MKKKQIFNTLEYQKVERKREKLQHHAYIRPLSNQKPG